MQSVSRFRFLGGRFSALFMAFAIVLAIPAMALADTLQINNDLRVGTNVTKNAGESGIGKVWLAVQDSSDSLNGCNATGDAPATVTFTSSDQAKIANPGSVRLTGCGTNAAVDFHYSVASGAAGGNVTISGAVTGGKGGTYTTTDTLTVTINAPTNAAPTVPGTPGLASGSSSPNQGAFGLTWTTSTDDGNPSGSSLTYTLQRKAADGTTYSNVATGLTTNSYSFGTKSATNPGGTDPEAEGTWIYRVAASDGSLQTPSNESGAIAVDKTAPDAPAISSPANDSYDNTGDVTVSGTAEANSTVEVFDGTSSVGTAKADADGRWSKALGNVAEGQHTYTAKATDAAGNTSGVSNARKATVDKTAPTAPTRVDLLAASDTGASDTDNVTSDTTPTFGVDAEAGSKVEVYKALEGAPDELLGSADANASGAAEVTSKPLGDGSYTITAKATDAAGNVSESSATINVKVGVTVDTAAPALTLPQDKVAEATGADGAAVEYAASASDKVDGDVAVSCSPASGATFAIGDTKVNCSATDKAGNKATGSFQVTVKDTTAPALDMPENKLVEATGADGAAVNFARTAKDAVDGAVAVNCTKGDQAVAVNSGDVFPIGDTTVNCSATDKAGNKATDSFKVTVQDTTAPTNISFVGGINDGGSFEFGDVPPQPTCSASDAVGVKSCVVSGYSNAVGNHTLTATATDNAGNSATKTLSYTVKPWTLKGFYSPVDMSTATTRVWNTVKNGSTVPLKFEIFKGTTELTDTAKVQPLSATKINCDTGTEDAIEVTATGSTSLRYDTTAGQFIYNWKTPTTLGCYSVKVTTNDGSSQTAYFKLK